MLTLDALITLLAKYFTYKSSRKPSPKIFFPLIELQAHLRPGEIPPWGRSSAVNYWISICVFVAMALREGGGKEERLHACTIRNSGKPPWIERARERQREGSSKTKLHTWRVTKMRGNESMLGAGGMRARMMFFLSLSPIFCLSLSLLFLMGENKKREIDGGGKRGIKRASLIYVKSCARLAE